MSAGFFSTAIGLAVLIAPTDVADAAPPGKDQPMSLQLTSTEFSQGQPIPVKFTCQGGDVSPALKWSGAPANTRSFALIVDDPDAPVGTWTHWVLYNMPGTTTELAENIAKTPTLPGGARQGVNDFRRVGYGGPCPPAGKPHRYFFKLYALDASLELKPGASLHEVIHAIKGHVLEQGELMGTYQRAN